MKLKRTICGFCTSTRTLLRFCMQHHAAMAMLPGIYSRDLPTAGAITTGIDTLLVVEPSGALYKVIVTDYINDQPVREDTWLAAYCWHAAGRLAEVGGGRLCTLNASASLLYLEDPQQERKLTVFIKSIKTVGL